jgi:hypothetical protein
VGPTCLLLDLCRWTILHEHVTTFTASRWAEDFISHLREVRTAPMMSSMPKAAHALRMQDVTSLAGWLFVIHVSC